MELRSLKVFVDIAKQKSFVRAAHANYLTQPSISLRLKQLESELGFRLFDRAPKKVAITREGQMLLPHVEELLRNFENLKTLAAGYKNAPKKSVLKIATIHSIGIYELMPTLKEFIRANPSIEVHLEYRPSRTIYGMVENREIDLGLVAYPYPHANLSITLFAKDELVLVVPPGHRLAHQKSVRIKDLHGEKFVAFDPAAPTRLAIDKVLADEKISVMINTINENIDTLKRAVEVSLGVSIVPRKTVLEEERKGTLKIIRIRGLTLERPLGILTASSAEPSESARLFMHALMASERRRRKK